jgi:hypothetical protein
MSGFSGPETLGTYAFYEGSLPAGYYAINGSYPGYTATPQDFYYGGNSVTDNIGLPLSSSSISTSSVYEIIGTVTSNASIDLPGATVKVNDAWAETWAAATTNSIGAFSISLPSNMTSGIYYLVVTDPGYLEGGQVFSYPSSFQQYVYQPPTIVLQPNITGVTGNYHGLAAAFGTSINGLAVQFTDTSTGTPINWSWNFGDSGTSTTENPSHTYSTAGMYGITLIVHDNYGDTSGSTQYIYIGTSAGVGTPTPLAVNESLAPGFTGLTPAQRQNNLNLSVNEASLFLPAFAAIAVVAMFTALFGRVGKGMRRKK